MAQPKSTLHVLHDLRANENREARRLVLSMVRLPVAARLRSDGGTRSNGRPRPCIVVAVQMEAELRVTVEREGQ